MQLHDDDGLPEFTATCAFFISMIGGVAYGIGDLMSGCWGELFKIVGGSMLFPFWAGMVTGWLICSRKYRMRERVNGESNRQSRAGKIVRGNPPD